MRAGAATVSIALLALTVAGCAVANRTGFLTAAAGAAPVAGSYSGGRLPIRLTDPEGTVVIVYSHGTTRPQSIEDCGTSSNAVPRSLLALQSDRVLIYYLCSQAREPNSTWGSAGRYIYDRLQEVEATLDELRGLGVPPRNIFLAGHSAGGWTSLMAARHFGGTFNAVIAVAPAFAGRKSDGSRFPWWRQEARPKQIREMLEAPEIRALVFAYYGDPFEGPEDLAFLAERYPRTVRLIAYGCPVANPHVVHLYDCREGATSELIAEYLRRMLREDPGAR